LKISLLGATGSIGTQTLDVAQNLGLDVVCLTAHSNIDLLEEQIRKFSPSLAVVYDENAALELKKRVGGMIEVAAGMEGLKQAASLSAADVVVNALVGNVGLLPTVAALEAGKTLALANKEVLVCAGEVVMPLAKKNGVEIMPIDSEHSAIFQCLAGTNRPQKIYLTASGGPFRGKTKADMAHVTPDEALAHPNWSMGAKISIDSATMMNKGLEVIEARWLFDIPAGQIDVLVHPQSVIHSMVEFEDGQILAQLGAPDMRLVIQYALTHPRRAANNFNRLDFAKHNNLTFTAPDMHNFPCLALAYAALEKGGLYPTVLNASNEAAVAAFLNKEISFLDIPAIIDKTMDAYNENNLMVNIDNILAAEAWAKDFVTKNRR